MTSFQSFIEKYTQEGVILKTIEEYDRTKEAFLFRNIINELAGSKNSIEAFNNWVSYILPKQIETKSFVSEDGIEIIFTDVVLNKPVRFERGKKIPLYPSYCRTYRSPYEGILETTVITRKAGAEDKKTKVILGPIPIMLGSILCNLHGMSKEELVKMGECVSDPFGYFIIGSERSIITFDKLRYNEALIFYKKKKVDHCPSLSITYKSNLEESKVFVLKLGKKTPAIKMKDPYTTEADSKHLPIFIVFKVMSGLGPREIIEGYIKRFVPDDCYRKVKNYLNISVINYNQISNPINYLYKKKNKYKEVKTGEDLETTVRNELNYKVLEIFNYIKDEKAKIKIKITTMAYFVAKYTLFMVGELPMDSRDSWKNKRFESAPVLIEQLFSSIFRTLLQDGKRTKGGVTKRDFNSFAEWLNSKSKDIIKTTFRSSFNTDNWGVRSKNFIRENHAEVTRRDTPLALWAQTVKNNTSISTNNHIPEVRELQPSQRNRHCVLETPEGKQVGVVKYNAVSGIFSIERDITKLEDIFDKECFTYSEQFNYTVLLNGFPHYFRDKSEIICCHPSFKSSLIRYRRAGLLPYDMEIIVDKKLQVLKIFMDSARPICPYLIVNKKTRQLVIDEMDAWKLPFQELLKNGCMEFLSVNEENEPNIIISKSVQHFYQVQKDLDTKTGKDLDYYMLITDYSHCNIDPLQMLSISAGVAPMCNRQMAPRSTYQAAMGKQSLGYFNTNYHLRFPQEFKQLYKAERSLTETDVYFIPSMDVMPSGQIANIAFFCDPDNQEDALVVSEDYINAGNLNYIKYRKYEKVIPTSSKTSEYILKIPAMYRNEDPRIYRHLDDNGLPRLDSYIEKGDCILGLVRSSGDKEHNQSSFAEEDEVGYVDRVYLLRENISQNVVVKIKIRKNRKYIAGDKLALRYAQKGTVGRVASRDELPKVVSGPNKGLVPDIMFNPHGFPSRQTAGLLIEGIMTKAALYNGKRVDVSAFRKIDIEEAKRTLRENDLDESGCEEMELYGQKLDHKVYFVPLYEQALKHHVMDKIQFRNTGSRDFKTHQPLGGRARGSGLRVGEMEKDAFVAHGVSSILKERMMKSSDEFKLIVCGTCGSIVNHKKCFVCDNSRPGVVLVPYVFKVFIHLLNGAAMDLRLRTKEVKHFED